jgi:hypothetical protein
MMFVNSDKVIGYRYMIIISALGLEGNQIILISIAHCDTLCPHSGVPFRGPFQMNIPR